MRTSRFKLDVFLGTYSFEIDGRVVSFSLDEAMRHPPEDHSIFRCGLIDNVVAEVHKASLDGKSMIQGPSVGAPINVKRTPYYLWSYWMIKCRVMNKVWI